MGLLDGKVVAMMGAGGGLGSVYAAAIARAGASIALADLSLDAVERAAQAISEAGGHSTALVGDATSARDVEALADRAEAQFGPIDIWMNAAGIYPRTLVAEMDEEEWDRVIQVNLKSVFLGARTAVRRMLPGGHGVILSVASGTGLRGAPRGAHYAASKAAIIAFTRSMAQELRGSGIRINCIGPGATDTAMWRVGKTEEEIRQLLVAGNVNKPADFSDVVVFLLSDVSWPLTGEFIARET